MHPEIESDHAGDCPVCGMALESTGASMSGHDEGEIRFLSIRFRVGAALTLPVFLIAMGKMIPGLGEVISGWFPGASAGWLQLALATPVVFWAGWIFLQRGWRSIVNRSPNMFTLVMMGVGAAWVYSTVAVLFPWSFPPSFRQTDGEIALYFEAASVITVLVLLGQLLEARARHRTGFAISALLEFVPLTAHRLSAEQRAGGGEEEDVPVEQIRPGDFLRVKPGEKVPIDGTVVNGSSHVDESMITGESMPVERAEGDPVIGGTINQAGAFILRAEQVGEKTVLARIIQMVSEAQRSRAPIQGVADAVAGYFVPAVLAVSLATFVAWWIWGPAPAASYALVNAVAVLIIACPCALGLATPMAIMVGIGRAARAGILIRNAEAIERIEKIDVLVTDKTGTLTEGFPSVTRTVVFDEVSKDEVLGLAAAVEACSEHPIARAILSEAEKRGIAIPAISHFRSTTGGGVEAEVASRVVLVGKAGYLTSTGIEIPEQLKNTATRLQAEAQIVVWVAAEGKTIGFIAVSDPIKATAPAAVAALHSVGVKLVMATGDNEASARAVGRQLGIDEIHADLSPEDKIALVKRLQATGQVVAMAGDGINDAPALAVADVGIAMGMGTDVAIESAPVTLVKGDLGAIVDAITLGHGVMRNIRQNLLFAFGYNALGIPVAAGVLYPFTGMLLDPMIAGAAMSLSSVSVIMNSLRLRRIKFSREASRRA